MKQRQIIKWLKIKAQGTWCKLQRSEIEGIGVFAIRNIPKGVDALGTTDGRIFRVYVSEMPLLPEHYQKLIRTYCIKRDNFYWVDGDFNSYELCAFLNHSKTPNVNEYFETIRPIKIGEELTIDYSMIDDDLVDKLKA